MAESDSPASGCVCECRASFLKTTAAAVLAAVLASCGGGSGGTGATGSGGGGTQQAAIMYSTTDIHFSAAKPYSDPPSNQTITATVRPASGTLYIIVEENSPQIATVSNVVATSATSGQATIVPASPSSLLAGSHVGTITVIACLNDPSCSSSQLAGSPTTITVQYDVGSALEADSVNPRVIPSGVAGNLLLRGHGFAIGDTVTIGSDVITSSSIDYYLDSDIRVNYPPMAAGTYPIAINSGAKSYTATLTVVDPTPFTAVLLPYPSGVVPTSIQSLEYDAQRRALYVVPGTGTLLRYAYDGTNWSAPTMVSIPGLQQVHLSPDGTQLLALTGVSTQLNIVELDPVALTSTTSTALPSSIATFTGDPVPRFSLANDGNAIIVVGLSYALTPPYDGNSTMFAFIFGTSSRTFSLLPLGNSGTSPIQPVSSGDGNLVAMGVFQYNASGSTVLGEGEPPLGGFGSSTDLNGDRFVQPYPYSGVPGVYLSTIGPGSNGYFPQPLEGAVINSAGTRTYVVERTQADPSPDLHIFDTSSAATAMPTNYPELASPTSPIALAGDPGIQAGDPGLGGTVPLLLAITVDSGTVFVAGQLGIAVQPVPQ